MDMTVTDPATVAALKAATTGVVLRDTKGHEIGRFVPTLEAELKAFGITMDEYNRRRNAPASECVSTTAVLERLRSLRDRA